MVRTVFPTGLVSHTSVTSLGASQVRTPGVIVNRNHIGVGEVGSSNLKNVSESEKIPNKEVKVKIQTCLYMNYMNKYI